MCRQPRAGASRGHIVAQHRHNGRDDHDDDNDPRRAAPGPGAGLHRLGRHAGARRDPRRRDRFAVVGLAAGGGDVALLAAQAADVRGGAGRRRGPGRRRGSCAARCPASTCSRARRRRPSSTATTPADIVLNGITGSLGLEPTLAALRAGRDARAGEQGVAGRRRPAGDRRGRARADRPGRLRALRAGPVPARRPRPTRCARLVLTASRRAVPRPAAAASWPTSPRSRRSPTRPGRWARSSPSTPRPWSTRGWR